MKAPILFIILTILCTACDTSDQPNIGTDKDLQTAEVGEVLPNWSEGYLDIHFINTGRGECCFYILPDGTTLLVDAGEIINEVFTIPNNHIPPHRTYAYYIKHFLPKGKSAIDYCSPSHFHIDHIGGEDTVCGVAENGGYLKSGLTALFDYVPYNHILDRAYPNYTEDTTTPPIEGQLAENWCKFVTWGVQSGKFTADRFTPGKKQIVLVNKANKYDNFSVFNICANGFVWSKNGLTGKKSSTGNPASCGFHISYGKFDYIACGDLTGSPQNLVAQYFYDIIGNKNLEAFKCHHHLASNSWGSQMQKLKFDPIVVLNHCFASTKPNIDKLEYVIPIISDFFATNIYPTLFEQYPESIAKITGHSGHIVLRVDPGGDNYNVYMLDDSNFEYRVKSIHGPYKSK